jgi:hypothetical protein
VATGLGAGVLEGSGALALTAPRARARLAAASTSMVGDGDLCSPSVRIDPVSAARCRWLLANAAENPLYDRRLPAEELGSILQRIRTGMRPAREPVVLVS